ncbi:MAG: hypothetical protein SX243_08195 [Acidobacteriota bacterium]|nr:hypothetical protein [Acidobacteriota bacterium]
MTPELSLFRRFAPPLRTPGTQTGLLCAILHLLIPPPASGQSLFASGNPFLNWFWVLLGTAIIWFFFYSFLYPRLLPHFGEIGSRAIFWPGVLLYFFTWWHLSTYTFFTYGFYYLWLQWSSLALLGLLSIWFLISFVRRR